MTHKVLLKRLKYALVIHLISMEIHYNLTKLPSLMQLHKLFHNYRFELNLTKICPKYTNKMHKLQMPFTSLLLIISYVLYDKRHS